MSEEKIRYLFVDDEKDTATTTATRDGINDQGIISVEVDEPQKFEEEVELLVEKIKTYDGLIFDLRLDDNHRSKAKYTAPPLAQALRSRTAEDKNVKDCPIVLCSTDNKIKKSYIGDQSSHDLFDYRFLKDESPNYNKISIKLQSLAMGYQEIVKLKGDISSVIGRDISEIDERVFGRYADRDAIIPVHEYAQFMVKVFLGQPGPLINEKFLASRFGIDLANSPDWKHVCNEVLKNAKYVGVFSDGWSRWWSDGVTSEFKRLTGKRLSSLDGNKRVRALVDATGFQGLKTADPVKGCSSKHFWTVCEHFKMPLDPLEGFKIYTSKEILPWQDHRYLSCTAALERLGYEKGLRVHPSEATRLAELKKSKSHGAQ